MSDKTSLSWIAEEAARLAAAGAVRGKSWSLAQICEHLALSIEGPARDPSGPPVPPSWAALGRFQRLKRKIMKHALFATGRFPEDAPAPEIVRPTGGSSCSDAIQRLQQAVVAFMRKRLRADARWVYHPLLGRMDGRQWQRFHLIHARHHFACLRPER